MEKNENLDVNAESTWLNPATKSKKQLKDWVLIRLGAPLVTVELSEEQLDVCIMDALEKYTKYASFDIQDLVVDLSGYQPNVGLNLSAYNIADIHDIAFGRDGYLYGYGGSDPFFGMPAYLQSYSGAGIFPFFNSSGHTGGSWIGLHNLHENLEMIHRMTGSMPQYRYFKSTKTLKLTPEPRPGYDERILITAECEPPLEELYANEYVKRLTLAYAKILLGTVRKKFQNVQLLGGGQIDMSIGDEGKEELDKIIENIRAEEAQGNFFDFN